MEGAEERDVPRSSPHVCFGLVPLHLHQRAVKGQLRNCFPISSGPGSPFLSTAMIPDFLTIESHSRAIYSDTSASDQRSKSTVFSSSLHGNSLDSMIMIQLLS